MFVLLKSHKEAYVLKSDYSFGGYKVEITVSPTTTLRQVELFDEKLELQLWCVGSADTGHMGRGVFNEICKTGSLEHTLIQCPVCHLFYTIPKGCVRVTARG